MASQGRLPPPKVTTSSPGGTQDFSRHILQSSSLTLENVARKISMFDARTYILSQTSASRYGALPASQLSCRKVLAGRSGFLRNQRLPQLKSTLSFFHQAFRVTQSRCSRSFLSDAQILRAVHRYLLSIEVAQRARFGFNATTRGRLTSVGTPEMLRTSS